MPFEPKHPVNLDPPSDEPISLEHLSKCDGTHEGFPTYVAIKVRNVPPSPGLPGDGHLQIDFPILIERQGTVFDVTGNKAYGPDGSYKVFAGRDASRALAQSSLKSEECRPDWYDLSDEHKKVLNDWYTFFSKRYNIKGKVEGAQNTGE